MKQRRHTAVIPAVAKQLQPAPKSGPSAPVPLREGALTQVSGGVKTASVNTPQHSW